MHKKVLSTLLLWGLLQDHPYARTPARFSSCLKEDERKKRRKENKRRRKQKTRGK